MKCIFHYFFSIFIITNQIYSCCQQITYWFLGCLMLQQPWIWRRPFLSVCLLKLGVSLFVQLFANIVIFKPNIQKLQLNLSFDISQSFDKAVCFLQKCFMINCFKINFRVEVSWWWVIYCISFSCFLSRKAAYSYKLCLHWSYIWSTFG